MHVRKEGSGKVAPAQARSRAVEAAAVAGGTGLVAGWLIPRGPVTTVEAISAVVAALAVGFASGWLMRSRWAMLLAPATFMLVFELARIRVDGPTVDGIRLDGIYSVIALISGRGVDALLMLLPMVVGVSYGVVLATRAEAPTGPVRRRHPVRHGVLALATVAVVGLVAVLLRPATLARQWFDRLSAPSKKYVVFENSAHTPPSDEPGRFARFMGDVVQSSADRPR